MIQYPDQTIQVTAPSNKAMIELASRTLQAITDGGDALGLYYSQLCLVTKKENTRQDPYLDVISYEKRDRRLTGFHRSWRSLVQDLQFFDSRVCVSGGGGYECTIIHICPPAALRPGFSAQHTHQRRHDICDRFFNAMSALDFDLDDLMGASMNILQQIKDALSIWQLSNAVYVEGRIDHKTAVLAANICRSIDPQEPWCKQLSSQDWRASIVGRASVFFSTLNSAGSGPLAELEASKRPTIMILDEGRYLAYKM